MKHLIFCTLMLVSISLCAQNGGQYSENSSVKLEYAGSSQVIIHNKQSCEAMIRVTYNNTVNDYIVAGNSSRLISTPVPGLVRAKTTTNCGFADYGNVELNITASLLPVKFVYLKAKKVDNTHIQVEFAVAEPVNVKQYNVQLSYDVNTWVNVALIFPADIEPGKPYSVTIKLPK